MATEEIVQLTERLPWGDVNITKSLIGYYPLTEDASDHSGNKRHGTIQGHVVFAPADGEKKAAWFTYPGSYIKLPEGAIPAVTETGSFSFAAWIRKQGGNLEGPTESGANSIAGSFNVDNRLGWLGLKVLWNPKGKDVSNEAFKQLRGGDITSRAAVGDCIWTHVAFTFDQSDLKYRFYINGKQTIEDDLPDMTADGRLGVLYYCNAIGAGLYSTFNGCIRDFVIADGALTAAQIAELMGQ